MRELLKRVLNARTIGYPLPPSLVKDIEAELAKPEPEPKPDYRRVLKEINEFIKADILPDEIKSELAKPNEPVARLAWFKKFDRDIAELVISDASQGDSFPVYTHPKDKQKPLSDDEIDNALIKAGITFPSAHYARLVARAIEQAHGIK